MLANKDFTFNLNVSIGSYPYKKPEKAWMVQYSTQTLTLPDLKDLQQRGKAFCYNFKDVDEGGLLTAHEKTLSGFSHTNIVFFDIDKMPYPMQEYIAHTPFKPSLAYTTISNGKDGKYGYRLLYAFQEPIQSIDEFDTIYYAIAAANGFTPRVYEDGTKYEFDYRKVNQQYYGGGANAETYETDLVYSIQDFSSYIVEGEALRLRIGSGVHRGSSKKKSFPIQNNIREQEKGQAYYSQLENPFYADLFSLPPKEFLFKYDPELIDLYNAAIATRRTLSEDGKYWIYPEDYQEVKRLWGTSKVYGRDWRVVSDKKRGVQRWQIGSGRRKRLYITAQIMKHNVPDITMEELIYCLVRERYHYYVNTDNKLNNKELIQIAENALKYDFTLSPCKHPKFSINKEYWIHDNITSNAAKNIVRKELREAEILSLYDFGLSVKENMVILQENGVKVGKSTLYALKKKYSPNEDKEFSKPEQ